MLRNKVHFSFEIRDKEAFVMKFRRSVSGKLLSQFHTDDKCGNRTEEKRSNEIKE